jgi:hypothetical protein
MRERGALQAVSADRVESLLSENGGLTTSALAEKTGGNRDRVLSLLRELEAAGRIRRTGQRRGTRWQTITHEDRIRDRAAELRRARCKHGGRFAFTGRREGSSPAMTIECRWITPTGATGMVAASRRDRQRARVRVILES